MQRIQPGSRVVLHFRVEQEDGSTALESTDDDPLELTLGEGVLPGGLEMALWGLTENAEQSIQLTPEQAWGRYDPQKIHSLSRADFAHLNDLSPGSFLSFTTPDGEEYPGRIISIEDDAVTVDFNHPLAGHSIRFWARIISVDNTGLKEDQDHVT